MLARNPIAGLFCFFFLAGVAAAAPPFPEYLVLNSLDGRPLGVEITAYGVGERYQDLVGVPQNYTVDPRRHKLQFQGYEPFDITIDRPDGTYMKLLGANACDWMEECRDTDRTDYTANVVFGVVQTNSDGTKNRVPTTPVRPIKVRANRDTVIVPYYQR